MSTTDPDMTPGTTDRATASRLGITARQARGTALIAGALLTAALIESGTLSLNWLPALVGLTYLAAAVASRSRGTLWGPALVITSVGLATVAWLETGRPADSFQFLALGAMAIGTGGVIAALLDQLPGWRVTPMSLAMPVLLFGTAALLDQQAVRPFAGEVWPYAVALALGGAFEVRPATTVSNRAERRAESSARS